MLSTEKQGELYHFNAKVLSKGVQFLALGVWVVTQLQHHLFLGQFLQK